VAVAFDLQPTLSGELVALRPLAATDRPGLFAVASDPLIWEQHPVPDRYREEEYAEFFEQALASGGALVVLESGTGQVIGSSRYHGYDETRSEIEVGWTFLARSHWGGRFNREVKYLMLRHAFRFVERVVFVVGLANQRSQRAVESIGGVVVGARPDAGGNASVLYEVTAAAFAREFEPR
jgi:RimJ/RimL family protein N-acetyltransferase